MTSFTRFNLSLTTITFNIALIMASDLWAMDAILRRLHNKAYECGECHQRFTRKTILKNHYAKEHPAYLLKHPEIVRSNKSTKEGKKKKWKCPIEECPNGYCRKGRLKLHFEQQHATDLADYPDLKRITKFDKQFPCPIANCPYGYTRRKRYEDHLKANHPQSNENTMVEDDRSDSEDESTKTWDNSSDNYSDSAPSEHEIRSAMTYDCTLCNDVSFTKPALLKKHFQKHHPAKYFLHADLFRESIEENDPWPCREWPPNEQTHKVPSNNTQDPL